MSPRRSFVFAIQTVAFLVVFPVSDVVVAQGLDVVTGSFGAFANGAAVHREIHLGDRVEFNITIRSLFADECRVSIGLEVESVGPSWQTVSLGLPVNGSAVVSVRPFSISPNQTINVSLAWSTGDEFILETGDRVRTQRGEYHLEFERDDCDGGGGGGPLGVDLYSVPQNFTVLCPRGHDEFLGTCKTPTEVILLTSLTLGTLIAMVIVAVVAIGRMRRGKPPILDPGQAPPPM